MKSNKNAVIPFNSADIISRQLKVSRNDLVAAVQSAHVELVAQLNSLTQFEQQLGIAPNEGENGGGGERTRVPVVPRRSVVPVARRRQRVPVVPRRSVVPVARRRQRVPVARRRSVVPVARRGRESSASR